MLTNDAIAHFGSAAALARALDLTPSAVSQWGERVPGLRQLQLHMMTDGALPADSYLVPQKLPEVLWE